MDGEDPILTELRLLREQQWTLHGALVRRMDAGFAELSGRADRTDARLDGLDARLDGLDARLDGLDARANQTDAHLAELARFTNDGFQQVVERSNRLQTAFERFVELTLEERRALRGLDARVSALERKGH